MQVRRARGSRWKILVLALFLWVARLGMVRAQQGTTIAPVVSDATGVTLAQSKRSDAAGNIDSKAGATREDWTSLLLAPNDLHANPPIVGENDDLPKFTRELLQVQWRHGDPIDLYVIRPKAVEKPPVILYLYSYPTETDRFKDDGYCQRITSGGFAAVGFVSALTGQRYHSRPMKEWFVSELQESLGASVHDVQMVLNYLATRRDLDLNHVGMFGAGSGGTIAILAAAVDPRIKALDLLDPWGDWPDWLAHSSLVPDEERPDYLKPEFFKRVAGLDPVEWLPKLVSQRIRLQQVADDSVTPDNAKQRIASALRATATAVRYDDTPALFRASSAGRLFQWLKQQLGANSPPAHAAAGSVPG